MPSPKSASPSVATNKGFPFYQVMDKIRSGGKFSRLADSWEKGKYYIYLDTYLMLHKPDGEYTLIVSEADIVAEDWYKLDE